MSDLFLSEDVRKLLQGKRVVLIGDSNIRGIYKDMIWLLNHNSFLPYECLGAKGEPRFPDFSIGNKDGRKISQELQSIFDDRNRDHRIMFDNLHSGRSYIESRYYHKEDDDIHVYFVFITRVWSKYLEKWLDDFEPENNGAKIDVLMMSSCLWDFNRWGPFGIQKYKENLNQLVNKVKEALQEGSHFVWHTGLPVGKELNSKAMRVPGLEFQCLTSRYNIIESNFFTSHKMAENGFHVIDLHYYSLMQSYRRNRDGIHWSPEANRGFTNLILTYLCLIIEQPLPNRTPLNFSLEKIKMMAQVASDKRMEEHIEVQKLTELASKQVMTEKEMQTSTQLKNILKHRTRATNEQIYWMNCYDYLPGKENWPATTPFGLPGYNYNALVRSSNRMHPYNNGARFRLGRGLRRGNGQGAFPCYQPTMAAQSHDYAGGIRNSTSNQRIESSTRGSPYSQRGLILNSQIQTPVRGRIRTPHYKSFGQWRGPRGGNVLASIQNMM